MLKRKRGFSKRVEVREEWGLKNAQITLVYTHELVKRIRRITGENEKGKCGSNSVLGNGRVQSIRDTKAERFKLSSNGRDVSVAIPHWSLLGLLKTSKFRVCL